MIAVHLQLQMDTSLNVLSKYKDAFVEINWRVTFMLDFYCPYITLNLHEWLYVKILHYKNWLSFVEANDLTFWILCLLIKEKNTVTLQMFNIKLAMSRNPFCRCSFLIVSLGRAHQHTTLKYWVRIFHCLWPLQYHKGIRVNTLNSSSHIKR